MTDDNPSPPPTLGEAGQQLWTSIVAEYELGPGELRLLEDACSEADLISAMTQEWQALGRPMTAKGSMGQIISHPMLQELRQHRNALRQLILAMKLPADPGDDNEVGTVIELSDGTSRMTRSASGSKAATARWSGRYGG